MTRATPLSITGAGEDTAPGFLRAVIRRLDFKRTVQAAVAVLALTLIAGLGLTPVGNAPTSIQLARLIETLVLGSVIFVAVVTADEAVAWGWPRAPSYSIAVVAGSTIGAMLGWQIRVWLGMTFAGPDTVLNTLHPFTHRVSMILFGILIGGMATFVNVNRRTALDASRRQHAAERARAQAQRRTLESQLQALQARVEPMFLFATLERIRTLYRDDATAAGSMLEDLITYLRAALPRLRESSSTVSQEVTLTRAWLDIVGRSAQHSTIDFDVAPEARAAHLPALVLLPLAQHAVAGAQAVAMWLKVSVRVDALRLHIDVHTSTDAFGSGVAGQPLLEQIAHRMTALYGGDARLECGRKDIAQGSRARIELPLERGSESPVEGQP
jgi:hypothetical protein